MVQPPGVQAASFKAPGCWPVSLTILAVPSITLAAHSWAIAAGMPILIPPSVRASMNSRENATPDPTNAMGFDLVVHLFTEERLTSQHEDLSFPDGLGIVSSTERNFNLVPIGFFQLKGGLLRVSAADDFRWVRFKLGLQHSSQHSCPHRSATKNSESIIFQRHVDSSEQQILEE
ncbi:hypothetical protein OGATHE_000500 [Ogataea polymorpha]|uniref:Uncharacterized protein n=1 Tax=Ogataea polymorpha TaxID=460523 RepID=A0A9P8PT86_9ASCO|nr:hypothetical protein OGATHE_000500 [Ogataea polymorpha]